MVIRTAAADQSCNPQLKANGEKIKPTKEYKFLGVTINNNLWFKKHIDNITKKGNKRNKILKCMSTKSWGWRLEIQKQLYIQYNRSGLEYASSSWSSWASKTATNRLQRVQNEALRTAAGLAKTCPMDPWNPSRTSLAPRPILISEAGSRRPRGISRRRLPSIGLVD